MNKKDNIAAIVVTYNPEINILSRLLDILKKQVNSIVLVDNGTGMYFREFFESRHRNNEFLICLGANCGVAVGQNVGIEWAKRNGKTHVILFDQDSLPEPDMVFNLLSAMRKLNSRGINVAAVGPRYQDERNINHPPFIRVSGLKIEKSFCQSLSEEIVESDMIISSGSLISLSTLAEVGGPLNELFIDQVDVEWCLRARSHGYALFGVCNAFMHHSLGQMPKYFWGRKFIHQNPLRHYYIFRNAVWLLFKSYVPIGWKFLFMRTIFVRFFFYVCFVKPRQSYLKMMTKGILDGLCGRLGRLQVGHMLE